MTNIIIIYFTDCFKRNVGNMSEKMRYEEKRKSHTSPGMEKVQLANQQEQPV